MQIMFGKVPQNKVDYGDNFVFDETQYYYNVETDGTFFSVEDTVGRCVVLKLRELPELIKALTILEIKSRPLIQAEDTEEELYSNKVYTV